jgi:cytidylate kinase
MIAETLQITLYGKNILEEAIWLNSNNEKVINKADEKSKNVFLSRRVGTFSNSIEENVAESVFDFLRKKADGGESFVVVGRCADFVLRDNPNVLRIFVTGDFSERVKRISETRGISESKAGDIIRKTDKQRKTYHNYFCDTKWGDSRHYDLLINSSSWESPKPLISFWRIFTHLG